MAEESDACSVAHGATGTAAHQHGTAPAASPATPAPAADRALVAVFANPVSGYLLRYAADAGYRTLLVEPDPARADAARMSASPSSRRYRTTWTAPTWWSPTTTARSSAPR